MMSLSMKDILTKLKNLKGGSFSLPSNLPFNLPANLPFNLQRREKILIYSAGAVLGFFLIAHLIIYPILDRRTNLQKQIKVRTEQLEEMRELKAEYQSLTKDVNNSEAKLKLRPKGFTLFSFLDDLAGKSSIKQNIENMKPSTSNLKGSPYTLSLVEMKINSLTMEQLVTFLHGVETSPNMIWVKRISITKGEKEGQLLNSILQVETFQL